ncbi:MAG: VWA domain-containing protein [Ilumatobacter fluminis]|uniref:VWA domain containing CoxE-like protein n=1 Tax=Ilumatobacter fluminis TaxID=467091 RepID=A0A4R7I2B2_9ACTN|nr:VWA domain-containing protein [Ilumatobacter fluminis]TDT17595.1 VWA domain containing CoxE-like protein [Ilumatobacter fluminis]
MSDPQRVSEAERMRRWRLVLGGGDADGTGAGLNGDDVRIDAAMGAVYDQESQPRRGGRGSGRAGGLGKSAPRVARWLGDIRTYFPTPVVQVMQRDAIDRLDLKQLLLEPELLESIEPDLHLVTTLVELNHLLPDETRATARQVIASVLADLERRLTDRTRAAVHGALARANRTRRPRAGDVDWGRTVHANLRHYQPDYRTVIPERLVGFGRRQRSLAKDVVIAVDQSGSMADSVVYASLFGAVLAQLPALRTQLIAFDTSVTDLTPVLHDPVDVLFGVQLGGGTDIAEALGYCRRLITRPNETVLVLISDLFEGGNADLMRARVARMVQSGVRVLCLLALSDEGAPVHDQQAAADLAALGATVMSCTPDRFPDVLADALEGR